MKRATLVIVLLAILVLGYAGITYNRLVAASTAADAQWSQVETQYQRRYDLIPNLVAAVQGVMEQEQEVFGALAEARTRYSSAGSAEEKVRAASEVESAFARLLVVIENYPELRSAQNVEALQAQIEGTENRISTERGRFNEEVRDYNLIVSRFPGKIVAAMFGFEPRSYFQSIEEAEEAPRVEL